MKARSVRTSSIRIQQLWKRISKTALLTLVFLFVVVGNVMPAFAQQNTTGIYDNYVNLFTGPVAASLKVNQLFTPQTTTPDVKFELAMSFKTFDSSDAGTSKEIAWDHIRDFDNNYVFILRICDASDTTETKCLFSKIPYTSIAPSAAAGLADPATSIYHYLYTASATFIPGTSIPIGLNKSLQMDKFHVLFPVNSMFSLSASGGAGSTSSINSLIVIGSPTTYKADAWYCGGEVTGESMPTDQPTDGIRQFSQLCGAGHPYFKIATTNTFKMPQTVQEAQSQTPASIAQVDTSPTTGDGLPECSMTNGTFGAGSFMGCIARLVFYVVYKPIALFAGILGNLFDFFLGYSLSDASYRADFAVKGWQLVRDISNIFFIIILVYTGLMTVFNGKSNMKQVLPNLILNALLINFSLFATRVVIDISNITARVFYNSVEVCEGRCEPRDAAGNIPNLKEGISGFKPLSEKIVSAFNPQKMFATGVLDQAKVVKNIGVARTADSASEIAGYFVIVSLIAALILFAIAMMFWKTAFFFLGRVIGLYVAMIFAPFAFLSRGNMPIVNNIKDLSWDNWVKDLFNYALLAPIFVFFLYIIYSFLESDFLSVYTAKIGGTFFETVIYIAIPMLIVYIMIQQGVKLASKYAGAIGAQIQAGAQKLAGFAGGVALGGTALLGGRVIGATATKLNESRAGAWLRDKAPDSWLARKTLKSINTISTGSYDARQTAIGKGLFKQMGVDTDKGLKTMGNALSAVGVTGLDLSVDARKGGHQADEKRRKENRENTAKLMEEKMSDDQIKAYNEKQKKLYAEKVDPFVEGAMMALYGKAAVEKWKNDPDKTNYDKAKATVLKDPKVQKGIADIPAPKEMKSVSQLNSVRRKEYAKKLEEGSVIDNILGKVPLVRSVTGADSRKRADKKAAKAIKDRNKIEEDLEKIESAIQHGFRDLIALEKFQDSASFTSLTPEEREDILKYGSIQKGSGPKDREGKHFYEILAANEQQEIDAQLKTLRTEENKKEYERYEKMVQTIESSRFNIKSINDDLKKLKDKMIEDIKNNASSTQKAASKKAWLEKLGEKEAAEKHNKIWSDVKKYQDEQKKKLKGDDDSKGDKK